MTQKDDLTFAIALNNVAVGKLTDDEVKMLKSRSVTTRFDFPETSVIEMGGYILMEYVTEMVE